MQAAAGNQATLRWLARSRVLAREVNWHQQRLDWIRAAIKDGRWDDADPPGAYFVFNSLSSDDMIWMYQRLTPAERKALEANLDKTHLGRARMYQAIENAKSHSDWWREKSEAINWQISQRNFTSYPDGAYWLINPLNDPDRTKIMKLLDRDDLDELIGHESAAAAAGVPYAHDIAKRAITARAERGQGELEKKVSDLVPGEHTIKVNGKEIEVADYSDPKADLRPAFKLLLTLNDTDLLRTLRSLSPVRLMSLMYHVDQLSDLGDNSFRMRYFLQRAQQDDNLRITSARQAVYDPYYKKPGNDYSHIMRVEHPLKHAPSIASWELMDVDFAEVSDDDTMTGAEVDKAWADAQPGRGGLLWPSKLNKRTVPNLWTAKQEAIKQLNNRHAEDELFIITCYLAVDSVLHAGAGFSGGPGLASTTRTTRGAGPFGTGGHLEPGEPPPTNVPGGRALAANDHDIPGVPGGPGRAANDNARPSGAPLEQPMPQEQPVPQVQQQGRTGTDDLPGPGNGSGGAPRDARSGNLRAVASGSGDDGLHRGPDPQPTATPENQGPGSGSAPSRSGPVPGSGGPSPEALAATRSATRQQRLANLRLKVRPQDMKGAPPAPGSNTPGHARSAHGWTDEMQAQLVNAPDRVFSGFNDSATPREVDVYWRNNGDVVITEAGKKTSVITAYGPSSTRGGNSPAPVEKWANSPKYVEIKGNEIVYPDHAQWVADGWPK